ncbi:MAG: lichenicidin A2 family type 2 lantibiotic [Butyrivibrio sp.]|nr:lichenicidin A2 family type 2 lantibiotic [Butyrivibrio sp.]
MGKDNIDQVVGASFENLNAEDMEQVQGAGDVDAETVTVIAPIGPPITPVVVSKILR